MSYDWCGGMDNPSTPNSTCFGACKFPIVPNEVTVPNITENIVPKIRFVIDEDSSHPLYYDAVNDVWVDT